MSFVYREPIKILRDILVSEMALEAGQVMLSNQKFEIPTVGLYLVLSYVGPGKVLSRNAQLQPDGTGGQVEVQSMTMQQMVQIDIMAYNDPAGGNQARARKEEIVMALGSFFSQQEQTKYAMQIARHPGQFSDTSFLEETEMMTRYTTTVVTSSVLQKIKKNPDFYNAFRTQLNTDPVTAKQPIEADPAIAYP